MLCSCCWHLHKDGCPLSKVAGLHVGLPQRQWQTLPELELGNLGGLLVQRPLQKQTISHVNLVK